MEVKYNEHTGELLIFGEEELQKGIFEARTTKVTKDGIRGFYKQVKKFQEKELKSHSELLELRIQQDEKHKANTEYRQSIIDIIEKHHPETKKLIDDEVEKELEAEAQELENTQE